MVYMPPEAKDVPKLMREMIKLVNNAIREGIPIPVVAGLLHYQFVTIHPFYDGNGRTGRLLATFILQRHNFGLNGYFSLEEHHAKELEKYYAALETTKHHNYYEGRETADLTKWLEYFTSLMAKVFEEVKNNVDKYVTDISIKEKPSVSHLRSLDRRQKLVLKLFKDSNTITTLEVANLLGVSPRMARFIIVDWVKTKFLKVYGESKKKRAYLLVNKYRKLIS